MPVRFILEKQKSYPRPHDLDTLWKMPALAAVANKHATSVPICRYDEGQGAPSSYNANPEHASFAKVTGPNCFPESRVPRITSQLEIRMTKSLLETDKIDSIKVGFMVYSLAFKEDYTAKDEMSTDTVGDVLELQTEDTDRQGYPIWNGNDTMDFYPDSNDLHDDEPGLGGDSNQEFITFDIDGYYDKLQYSMISKKLQKVCSGIKWIVLTRRKPYVRIRIKQRSKTKFMNPYSLHGVHVFVPESDTKHQIIDSAFLTTDLGHLSFRLQSRYHEWNQNFDMEKV